ncbi:MAG: lipid-A-disaccharide synthase [Puniceicoccales bacterium]|nr:lipid-A-disaccharide synthase [Puniceicoccales bacterium]
MAPLAELPPAFDAPRNDAKVDILFIAGEHSGDEHSAVIIEELLSRRPELNIAALGGQHMAESGAQLLFDMTRFSAVGIVEVISNYGFYKKLFDRTLAWIRKYQPRMVCFVDYPGFNLRIADRLTKEGLSQKGGGAIKLCYYISPQIWAWKSGRRFEMARVLDSLGVIFPFEVDCYKDTDLPVRFVGHPFVNPRHKPMVRYSPDGPVLLVPGSRPKPVRKIFPILLQAWQIYHKDHPDRRAVVIHPGEPVRSVLYELMVKWSDAARGIDLVERGTAQTACAQLASSGTMSLNTALAGIPGAIVYRANPITWMIGRQIVKGVEYLGIMNILLKRPAWPEYLQNDAIPEKLAERLKACTDDPAIIYAAQEDAAMLHTMLGGAADSHCSPADWLLENL